MAATVTCAICRRDAATVGVLCDDCRDDLVTPIAFSPEQIEPHAIDPTSSAVVDLWGRAFRVDAHTAIGRQRQTLTLLEASVSRRHAALARADDAWVVRDLGSQNGTFVDGRRVTRAEPLRDGAIVRFGHVAFYFVHDAAQLPVRPRRASSPTLQAPAESRATTLELPAADRPTVAFTFHEPTGGGGGFIEVDGIPIQLTLAQLELVTALVDRMAADVDADDHVRGFVQTHELRGLSLDSTEPGFDHVRHLIRRVRKRFVEAGVGDLVESQHGRGYRLRVIPRREPARARP